MSQHIAGENGRLGGGPIVAPDDPRLMQMIEALPQLACVTSLDGACVFVNGRWAQYTGIEPSRQRGLDWTAHVHEQDRSRVRAAWTRAAAGDTIQIYCRFRSSTGEYRWFETCGTPLRDAQGNIVNWFGVHTDVHELYETRRQLAEAEARFAHVALATNDAIYEWDMKSGLSYCNDRFKELFKPPPVPSQGAWWRERIHADDHQRVEASARAAFAARSPVWMEQYRVALADGSYATVTDRAYVMYDPEGAPARFIGAITDVSARHRAELTLRDTQARLLAAIDAGGLATWSWDARTDSFTWDDAAYRLWGVRKEDANPLTMTKLHSFVHANDQERIGEAIERFSRTGITESLEFRVTLPDGQLRWLLTKGLLEHDADGQPLRMAGVYIDITDRKRIEQSLHESQARLVSAMLAGGLATWTWDVIANALTWDEDTCRLWGRRPDEFRTLSYDQILAMVHPDDRQRLLNADVEFRASGAIGNIEFRTLRPDGALQWLSASGQADRDATGKPVRMSGVYLDVTESKRVEQSLRDTQARLKSAMQAAGLSTWIWDVENDVLTWDDDAYRLWGRTPGEFDKLSFAQAVAFTHPDDRPTLFAIGETFLRTGVETPVDFRVVLPDNSVRWILAKGQLEVNDHGKPKRMVGVYFDVTERKRAEAARLNSQKLEALGTLAGGIAHDFNNILLAITGNARLLLQDFASDSLDRDSTQRSLREIEKAAARAGDLVKRILTFSRQQDMQRAAVALRPQIDDALRLLRHTLPAHIELRTSLEDDTLVAKIDATQFHQIIVNLVTNAAHAIGPRSGTISIELSRRHIDSATTREFDNIVPGDYACLTVSDTGGGVDPAIMHRIFDPFFTTKNPGEGTGLGLAVVHGIAKAQGGAVTVTSQPGRGARFSVYLPLSQASIDAAAKLETITRRGMGQHVLYVDDEEALVFLTSRVLERLGYRVTGCVDPVLALNALRSESADFDVVVTDLSMRGMNGFELARAIKAFRPTMPILLTSGYLRNEDRELAAELGIRELILKPNTVEELGRAIDRTLQSNTC